MATVGIFYFAWPLISKTLCQGGNKLFSAPHALQIICGIEWRASNMARRYSRAINGENAASLLDDIGVIGRHIMRSPHVVDFLVMISTPEYHVKIFISGDDIFIKL